MAGNPARKRKLRKQFFQPSFVSADVGIDLAVGAFEIGIAYQRRTAVTGTGDVEHVQVIFLDDPVQMYIDEILAWSRAPVSDHQGLHMSQRERFAEQRVIVKIKLTDGQIICSAPISIELAQTFGVQRLPDRGSGDAVGFVLERIG